MVCGGVVVGALDSQTNRKRGFEDLVENKEVMVDEAAYEQVEKNVVREVEICNEVAHVVVSLQQIKAVNLYPFENKNNSYINTKIPTKAMEKET